MVSVQEKDGRENHSWEELWEQRDFETDSLDTLLIKIKIQLGHKVYDMQLKSFIRMDPL